MANHAAIEQQHRHFQPELADELRVGVDVDHGNRRDGLGSLELGQLVEHFFTEPAPLAGDDDEALFQGGLLAAGYLRWGASPMAAGACWDLEAFTCLAKNS